MRTVTVLKAFCGRSVGKYGMFQNVLENRKRFENVSERFTELEQNPERSHRFESFCMRVEPQVFQQNRNVNKNKSYLPL